MKRNVGSQILVLTVLLLCSTRVVLGQTEKVVLYDYTTGQKTSDPKLVEGDSIKFTILNLNPISYDYAITREETLINPLSNLPPELKGILGGLGLSLAVSGPPNCDLMDAKIRDLCLSSILLAKQYDAIFAAAGGLDKLMKEVVRLPVVAQSHAGDVLRKDVADLRARADQTDPTKLKSDFSNLKAARESLAAALTTRRGGLDPALGNDFGSIETYVKNLKGDLDDLGSKLQKADDLIKRISDKISFYEQLLKSLGTSPYTETLGQKKAGTLINVHIVRTISQAAQKDLKDIKDEAAVTEYLNAPKEEKGFQMFVESKLPLVFHTGYAYARLSDVKFDRVADPSDPSKLVLGRTQDSKFRNSAIAFASFPLVSSLNKTWLKEVGLYATIGSQINDPAKIWYFAPSFSFKGRAFLSIGGAVGELTELQSGAKEGMTITATQVLPTVNRKHFKFFFSISFRPY